MNPNDDKITFDYLVWEEGKSNGEQYSVPSYQMREAKIDSIWEQPPSAVRRAKLDYELSRSARSSENEFTTMSAPALTSVSLSKVVVIAVVKQPAAFAARSPFTESSTAQHSAAFNCSFSRVMRNTSGSGFGR